MAENTRGMLAWWFARHLREYEDNLKLDDLMEATPQATQREITLASMALVKRALPKVHVFNELLIQSQKKGSDVPLQVCPDNMVVLHDGPLEVEGSYDVQMQPARPFLVMEYVSKSSKRKDHEYSAEKYEQGLKVPYYLMFHPEIQELTLLRLRGKKHISVKPNAAGRYPIPELELEVGILDGWMRYWFRGGLIPLPAELMDRVEAAEAARKAAEAALARSERRVADLERELAEMRARLGGK